MEIAISSNSFRRAFEQGLDIPEFINLAGERYGVNSVELSSAHIKSRLPAYIEDVKKALKSRDIGILSVLCECAHMYDPEPDEAEKNTNMVRRWMRIAQSLGAKAMRVSSGGEIVEESLRELKRIHEALGSEGEEGDDEDVSRQKTIAGIVNGFRRVSYTAQTFNIVLLLENHDGPYGNSETVLQILNEISHPFVKASVDTSGIPPTDFRYREIMSLIPAAHMVRIKTMDFDQAGNETSLDMDECARHIKESAFQGALVLEYGGGGDEYEGMDNTAALIGRSFA